jgi:hypothetical protein
MIEHIAVLLLILLRFLLMYAVPLFNTIKLQSLPEEAHSERNRKMLVYWAIVVLLYLVRHLLFFFNE